MRSAIPHHLIQLPANTDGQDFIIGDPHGKNKGIRTLLTTLSPKDRLFCPGDLFDRGPNSLDVFEAIMEKKDQIFISRGNHENILLKTITILQNEWLRDSTLKDESAEHLIGHILKSGGEWVLGTEEEAKKAIADARVRYATTNLKPTQDAQSVPIEYLAPKNATMHPKTLLIREMLLKAKLRSTDPHFRRLLEIKDYIKSLPYLIFVGDFNYLKSAFMICHAQKPFSDNELQKRFATNQFTLSDIEIHTITNARPDAPNAKSSALGNYAKSIRHYAGHNPIGTITTDRPEEGFQEITSYRAVRPETNTIVIDASALQPTRDAQLLFVINHHTQGVHLHMAEPCNPQDANLLEINQYLTQIQTYLDQEKQILASYNKLLDFKTKLNLFLEANAKSLTEEIPQDKKSETTFGSHSAFFKVDTHTFDTLTDISKQEKDSATLLLKTIDQLLKDDCEAALPEELPDVVSDVLKNIHAELITMGVATNWVLCKEF